MAGEIEGVVQEIATEENIAMATEAGANFFDLAVKLSFDAIDLIQANILWAVVLVLIIKGEDMVIEHFDLPVPKGKVRWIALFFLTMFFAWAFVPIVEGFI